jgi:hypothetical protein
MTLDKCLVPGCEGIYTARAGSTRGLCANCRSMARKAISRGDATEDELVRLGLLLPSEGRGRPRASGKLYRALEAARKNNSENPEK